MPELPEVEIAARNLRAWALGRRVVAVEVDGKAGRILRPASAAAFARSARGRTVESVRRLGKHLLIALGPPSRGRGLRDLGLLSHLGMTGKWLRREEGAEPPSHSRVRLHLDDGATLHYRDPRLFGRLRLVPGARFEEVAELRALGPDPLEQGIDRERLEKLLARSRRPVKVALLDQRLLPGVGNIHASEGLFRARIDPRRRASSLSPAEVRALARGILSSFRRALAAEEGPEIAYVEEGGKNPFLVYAREGQRCPRCRRGTIRRIVQAQRATFYCPRCQHPGLAKRARSLSRGKSSGSSTPLARV